MPISLRVIDLENTLPTTVVICRDCGSIRYGSAFLRVVNCKICNGRRFVVHKLHGKYTKTGE